MFEFLRHKKGPVICQRQDHCISRKNIDPDALKVLYRLNSLGYKAYLVGGGVRDLLLGRAPKDFDVGTDAKPNEVKRAFRNCFLVGRRFRLAHVRFGQKVIETATFRANSQSVGDIIEHADEGPMEDNTFGTPETDANRRDFTVNGLFYDIKTFAVIDYVGGFKDLKKKVIRSIGDPMIRFREDPVRMMRAIKFSSRLDFDIERKTAKAICALHSCILNAAKPRVCEEVFRLFSYGSSEKAFRMMWKCGMLHDLLPGLSDYITKSGGLKSPEWKYLAMLDRYDRGMAKHGIEVSNAIRVAALYAPYIRGERAAAGRNAGGVARQILGDMVKTLGVPKTTYFTAVVLCDSERRLSQPPQRGHLRFVRNKDFPDALDYNRIVARVEGRDETVLDKWADACEKQPTDETRK